MSQPERGIWLDDATHREDLATFIERALRLDDAAVVRLRERAGGLVVAWVATGFDHLDDVPARAVLDLAQRGVSLAKEHSSAHGPPASLLDQEVVAVSSGDTSLGIPMRCVFALTAMGFLPQSEAAGREMGLDPDTVSA